MITPETRPTSQDRVDEFMAVINMIGYARGVAETLGVPGAASDLQAAGLKLALEIQREMSWNLTSKDIIDMAVTPHGRC
ncbi:hypothetical protein FDK21_18125 [Cohaesibacter sp. CAU 1516]|uniref:hypothetical protein n=2 Tax=Cohaesibacter TaxID=655352 RepID=UPI000DE99F29|nr:hypothetical protein [Cohaesibacter sp. CAU 1516]TLP43134.1 hypothetical protein FDK21_18125 [Cohaesibacter sp. CAU 1516]